MPNYRRLRVPGGTYFFTANLLDRSSSLLTIHIDAFRTTVRAVQGTSPFHIDAWVILPDHTHCIWTLPEGDTDYAGRWRALKKNFTKSLPPTEPRSPTRLSRGERGVWQRRFWEHTIRDDTDYARHMDYVHFNPVKHGLADHPASWPYSTFTRCVRAGLYSPSWSSPSDPTVDYGERPNPT